MKEPKALIKAIETILDPSREIHMDKEGNFGRAYLAREIAAFIIKYVDVVIGKDEAVLNGFIDARNKLRAEQRQRAKMNVEYPHAFGCEKFDDGECNCGYEKREG